MCHKILPNLPPACRSEDKLLFDGLSVREIAALTRDAKSLDQKL